MEINFLNSFLLTAETGSMAEAARRLSLTPAAVAQQIRVVERALDRPLVVRSGRRVRPTEDGLRLLEHARELVRSFEALKAKVNEDFALGELRIGAIHSAQLSIMPDVISDFASHRPQVRIRMGAGTTLELYELLVRDELDAAFCLKPEFPLPKTIRWTLVREEPLVLLVPPRLAHADPHDVIRTEPFIRYERSLSGGRQADRYLQKFGLVPRERFEFTSLVAIAMMVDRGLGVSVVPDVPAPHLAALNVVRIPLKGMAEPRLFGMLSPRTSARQSLIESLCESAQRAATWTTLKQDALGVGNHSFQEFRTAECPVADGQE